MTFQHLNTVAMGWNEAMIPITMFVVFGFVLWTWFNSRQQRAAIEGRTKLQEKMIDRFSTSEELAAFLRTDEGSKYLDSLTSSPISNPFERVTGTVKTGLIIVFAAVGLIAAGAVDGDVHGTLAIGVLALFVGVGFLASAFFTHRMAGHFGLIGEPRSKEPSDIR